MRAVRVLLAVLLRRGIEVTARAREIRRIALADRVDVKRVDAGRQLRDGRVDLEGRATNGRHDRGRAELDAGGVANGGRGASRGLAKRGRRGDQRGNPEQMSTGHGSSNPQVPMISQDPARPPGLTPCLDRADDLAAFQSADYRRLASGARWGLLKGRAYAWQDLGSRCGDHREWVRRQESVWLGAGRPGRDVFGHGHRQDGGRDVRRPHRWWSSSRVRPLTRSAPRSSTH